jgi:arylsulfatase A-like enzyme
MKEEQVILILCDTLRAKSLIHYGNERDTTPNLNPIIERDFTVYSRAYSPGPWTPPAHLSLFSGLYPSQVMESNVSYNLNPVFTTMADLFSDSGYKTFAISSNAIVSKKLGYEKGFSNFIQLWLPDPHADELSFRLSGTNKLQKVASLLSHLASRDMRMTAIRGLRENYYKKHHSVLNDATPFTDKAIRILKKIIGENRNEKLFCFVNLLQTHNRYNPPPMARNIFVRDNKAYETSLKTRLQMEHYTLEPFSEEYIEYCKLLYEEEILYLDKVLSGLIEFLKETGTYESSTLIITSDHGEHFGENGHIAHTFSVFEPLIRIPLYIKWSEKYKRGNHSDSRLVMLQDIYSTFISLLDHWHPCPESSYDLFSSTKRKWIISQLDMSSTVDTYRRRYPDFSLDRVGLKHDLLNAYVLDDGIKLIENGDTIMAYNLEADPGESIPFAPHEKYIHILDAIKKDIV